MMIHTNRRWEKAVTANIQLYGLLMANKVMNETPSFQNPEKKIPQAVFSGPQVEPNFKHWKTSRLLVYVLGSALEATKPHHKWSERSRVRVYLGNFSIHSKNVMLVLSLNTGPVSPQFYVKFDTQYQTVEQEELSL